MGNLRLVVMRRKIPETQLLAKLTKSVIIKKYLKLNQGNSSEGISFKVIRNCRKSAQRINICELQISQPGPVYCPSLGDKAHSRNFPFVSLFWFHSQQCGREYLIPEIITMQINALFLEFFNFTEIPQNNFYTLPLTTYILAN